MRPSRCFVASSQRQTEMLGKNHFLVARAQNNLATLLRAKADYKGAEDALLEALRIYESGREPDQLDLAIAHHNLAGVYREAGDFGARFGACGSGDCVQARSGRAGQSAVGQLVTGKIRCLA